MLITLQKESQLLDRTDPTETTYNAAWGWHCPDTGPGGTANCDPAYAGLVNQAYGMAKQWARYRVDPGKYNYQAGQTVTILWNVAESGCGGAPVTIANQATAALYNYTPYQPNAASLAAYPGTGDACSTYGNRNFFYLFVKNFGPTGGGKPDPNGSSSGTVSATGPDVTIPNNPNVTPAMAGRAITAPNAAVATGLAAGFNALGLPYVWGGGGGGGAGPNNGCDRGGGDYNSCGSEIGFDCSGLTAYVMAQAGFTAADNSSSQRTAGTPVPWEQGQPGDIVGFPGHVAIYLGTIDGTRYILEASWVGTPIHVVPLTRTDYDFELHRYWS
jgi:cell wall-associated NlpC family hydrolase